MKLLEKIKNNYAVENVHYNKEPGNKNDWWIYLKDGYICLKTESTTIHESTLTECYKSLKSVVTFEDFCKLGTLKNKQINNELTDFLKKHLMKPHKFCKISGFTIETVKAIKTGKKPVPEYMKKMIELLDFKYNTTGNF